MAVKNITEIMDTLRAYLGEDVSDEALVFIEDLNDTLSNYERMVADQTDWESKYKELDESWRTRYRDRFFESGAEDEKGSFIEDVNDVEEQQDDEPETFEELFEEVKEK